MALVKPSQLEEVVPEAQQVAIPVPIPAASPIPVPIPTQAPLPVFSGEPAAIPRETATSCCFHCGDAACDSEFTDLFRPFEGPDIVLVKHGSRNVSVRVPRPYFGNTSYIRLFLKPGMHCKPLTFDAEEVCRRHHRGSCDKGVQCKFLHVCRQWWMRSQLMDCRLNSREPIRFNIPNINVPVQKPQPVAAITAPIQSQSQQEANETAEKQRLSQMLSTFQQSFKNSSLESLLKLY